MDVVSFKQTSAFIEGQEAGDEWAARLYRDYGLGINPSADTVEPVAQELWTRGDRQVAAEMVMGRRIEGDEMAGDTVLAQLMHASDPDQAIGGLFFLRDLESTPPLPDDSPLLA